MLCKINLYSHPGLTWTVDYTILPRRGDIINVAIQGSNWVKVDKIKLNRTIKKDVHAAELFCFPPREEDNKEEARQVSK